MVLAIGIGLIVKSYGRVRRERKQGDDHHHDHHDHDHGHDHDHDDHDHDHHGHGHSHGPGPGHNHQPHPGEQSAWIGWKGLVALGLTGGLVPSASAVVLLLGAVSLGRVEFGLALVAAFGVGMAAAMVAVGLGLVAATKWGIKKLPGISWQPRLTTILPAAMGIVVSLIGAGMLLTAVRSVIGA
jgi:ABC-type nickel/cobalt efflux system permease component RcnA